MTSAPALLPLPAVAGLLSAGSAVAGGAMLWAAGRKGTAGPRLRAVVLGAGAVLTGAAGAAGGIAVLVAPEAKVDGVPLPAEIPLVCLFLAVVLYLPGVLRPHQRRDPLARLRVGLDTVGVAACLMFPPWLILVSTGERRGAATTAILFGGTATAVAAVAGVHAIRHRAALQWCGPGAALSLLGLTALTVAMDYPDKSNAAIAALAAAAAMNVAAGLLWLGSVRVRPDGGPLPPAGTESAAGFPLFALPVLSAALVTAHHLLHGGRLDAGSIILATTVLLAVAAREYTASIALRRRADHLTDQGNRLRSLVFGSSGVAMVLDADLVVRWQSPGAARLFALSDQDVLGRPVSALVHPAQAGRVLAYLTARLLDGGDAGPALAVRLRDGYGRWRQTEWTAGGADPAEPGRTVVVYVRDVTDRQELDESPRPAAHQDPLTGLANRRGLRSAGEAAETGALLVLDLGGLTAINDVHGPDVAEMVLAEAARRLRTRVEPTDVPARIGDSRFAVLTRGGAIRAHVLASRLITVLTAAYTAGGTEAHVSVWAGMADVTADAGFDEAARRAALALRAIRSGPPGTAEWYDEEMEDRLVRRSTLEQDLPGAVTRGQLELSYRPVVELPGRHPVGVEAVLGWRHPVVGPVPGGELLSLAEDLGLLGDVRQWALHRAVGQLAGWRRRHDDLWLAVLVRPRELLDPVFQADLDATLDTHRIPESALVVEIAEHDLLDGPGAQQPAFEDVAVELGRLRARGVRTAAAGFGGGPTSLRRLRVLPVDLLQIDREMFGRPDGVADELGAIVDVTVTLGRRLGMEVIAQGLREPAELDIVQAAGCRLGQGDLLGRAMPAEHLEAWLEQHGSRISRGG